jgi:hypothetical protein
MTDSRYPYTYACDYIRQFSPVRPGEGVVLGRSDASRIRQGVAVAIGMSDEKLAALLADRFLLDEQNEEFVNARTEALVVVREGDRPDADISRLRALLARSLEYLNGYAVLFPSHDTSELARAVFEELEKGK